jgi:LysM repeat protein
VDGATPAAGILALSGSGTPGAEVEILDGNTVIATVTLSDHGTWTYEGEAEAGDHALSARYAGDAASQTEAINVTLGAALTVSASEDSATLDAGTLALNGTGAPGAEVEILDGDMVIATITVGDDGTWTYEGEAEAGDHALSARYVGDAASQTEAINVTVDKVTEATTETPSPDDNDTKSCRTGEIPLGEDRGDTYVVARCEFMALIAARTQVKLANLIAVNPQVANVNLIYPGQILNLPPRD